MELVLTGHQILAMYVFLTSLLVGSFIGVLTYRLPRGVGFVLGRSVCDHCKKELRWYDNIPLFSYLWYRAKSRCCGNKISYRYPLIELLFSVSAVVLYLNFGFSLQFTIYYLLLIFTVSILIIDLENQIIPDELSWLVLLLGLFTVHDSLFSTLFPAFFFSLLLLILHLITYGRGMGLGDVKLAIGLGIWLGWTNGWQWLLLSFVIGGIVSVFLLLFKKARLKTKLAFGPFLVIAFWITLLMT